MSHKRPTTANHRPARETPGPSYGSRHESIRNLAATGTPLHMRRATRDDFETIDQMIEDAKVRLRDLGTDQWSTDWPDEVGHRRMDRVVCSIKEQKTWLAELWPKDAAQLTGLRAGDTAGSEPFPVATVTVDENGSPAVWTPAELKSYRALYLSRLVVAKGFSGFHLGSAIIDWAGHRAQKKYDARTIRIDVWTTNVALHNYYEKRGFERCGLVRDVNYPARQRFERSTGYQTALGPEVRDQPADDRIDGW